MEKVYVIIRSSMTHLDGLTISTYVYATKEDAMQSFDEICAECLKNYEGIVDICEMNETHASFYNEGTYLEWHDDIRIEEKKILGTSI